MPCFIEIGLGVLKKKILKVHQCIFPISILSPRRKGRMALHLNNLASILFIQWCFVLSLVEICPVVLGKLLDENVKSSQTDGWTDGRTVRWTTDNRWSERLTWAFSSNDITWANNCRFHTTLFKVRWRNKQCLKRK